MYKLLLYRVAFPRTFLNDLQGRCCLRSCLLGEKARAVQSTVAGAPVGAGGAGGADRAIGAVGGGPCGARGSMWSGGACGCRCGHGWQGSSAVGGAAHT